MQNSSGGHDEFPAILLKQCSKIQAHPLLLLYKASVKTGEIPIDLKRAIITRTYVGGSKNFPKNYRPVALASHWIKILKKNLPKNIHQFLETHQKMNPKQHGFRSGRSCLSQLLEHHNKILEELEKSNNVDVIYLGFAKKRLLKSTTAYYWTNSKKSEFVVKSVCGFTIFYQTDNNVLSSMEQHQVRLKSEVAYPKSQC